jgi:glycine dehydrogenase
MSTIAQEIEAIAGGKADKLDNALKNAPHTMDEVCASEWKHAYSREQAAFPAAWLKEHKFWPSVARIDNAYGDKNLICACPSLDTYKS